MATTLISDLSEKSVVVVGGGVVHFVDFVESDSEVVRVMAEVDDPEAAAHSLLRIGGHAVRVASTDLDTDRVERRFESMAQAFDAALASVVAGITEATSHLLDEENGGLSTVINGATADLARLLDDTFDDDSKSSVVAKIERVLSERAEQLGASVKATFNLDQPDSPLARTKQELAALVKEEVRVIATEVRELAIVVAGKNAAAGLANKLTTKGARFEGLIANRLDPIASVHGDIVERVGTKTGSAGTKRGDHLVTVCQEDTCGFEGRFVLEAKDRRLSMGKTMAELDAAMLNHDAAAAIAVFAHADLSPVSTPFSYSGNRAILVFDKEDPDDKALQFAYEWARWVVRRSLNPADESGVDVAEVEATITRVLQALTKRRTVTACHSTIHRKVEEAEKHANDLVDEVHIAMADLRTALNRS